jgi:hypothetical protein
MRKKRKKQHDAYVFNVTFETPQRITFKDTQNNVDGIENTFLIMRNKQREEREQNKKVNNNEENPDAVVRVIEMNNKGIVHAEGIADIALFKLDRWRGNKGREEE